MLLGWGVIEALARTWPALLPASVLAITGRATAGAKRQARVRSAWQALHVPDPVLGYRYRPHLDVRLYGDPDLCFRLRTGSQGLRTEVAGSDVDVAVVGDSFALGFGVDEEETWSSRLQVLTGLAVANLGVGGFGSLQALRMLAAEALPLRPRFILWQLFEDDLWGASEFRRWQESGHPDFLAWQEQQLSLGQPPVAASSRASSVRGFLFRHVIAYELAKYALRVGAYAIRRQKPAVVQVGGRRLWLDPAAGRIWSDFASAAVQQGWTLTQKALLESQRLAEQAGVGLILVVVPAKEEVYQPWLRPPARGGPLPLVGHVRKRLVQFCGEQGLACLDLYPAFAVAAAAGQALYLDRDLHWNAAGHALAARALSGYLPRQGYLGQQVTTVGSDGGQAS